MKKLVLLVTFSLFTLHYSLNACTTFFINHKGQLLFGRNYDWLTGSGMIFTNQKGLYKVSDKTRDGNSISWTSLYGSITFNQYGKEFPTGGMNEKGLVVELMWLDATRYPSPDERPSIGVLQWIQYQLDNCSTVDELIATDQKIRITSKGTPLHYLVADAKGNAATIEFLEGKMKVHRGNDLPFAVLTNDTYSSSLNYTKIMNRVSEPIFGTGSKDRFAKTCANIQSFFATKKDPVDQSFEMLDDVKQDNTVWSIVYDITNKKIYFKTTNHSSVKDISLNSFDFNCAKASLAWEMDQPAKGNLDALFVVYTENLNKKLVNRSFDESSSQFTVSEADRREQWEYPNSITCKQK